MSETDDDRPDAGHNRRRGGSDRRKDGEGVPLRDRRMEERRGLVPGTTYSSPDAIAEIIMWIDAHAQHDWKLLCERTGNRKSFRYLFESDDDKQAFLKMLEAYKASLG